MIRDMSDPVPLETYTLEAIKFGLQDRLGAFALERLRLDVTPDWMAREVFLRIETAFLGRELPEGVETREEEEQVTSTHPPQPFNWWDAVKLRFAPAWFLRRYPAKTVTLERTLLRHIHKTIKQFHLCPHLNADPQQNHMRFVAGFKEERRDRRRFY